MDITSEEIGRRYESMKHLSMSELQELGSMPTKLFSELIDIYLSDANEKEKTFSKTVVELNNKFGLDILLIASEAIKNNQNDFWCIQHILENAIPEFNLNIKSALVYIKAVYDYIQNDIFSGTQYTPFERLAEHKPHIAKKLLRKLSSINEVYVVGYIASLYVGLSRNNLKKIHSELKSINPMTFALAKAKISALGRLNYDENIDLVEGSINVIDVLIKENIADLRGVIIQALGDLLKYSDASVSRLLGFSEQNNQEINYHISCVLLLSQSNKAGGEWFSEILQNLCTTKCESKGTIDNIDCILNTIIRRESDISIVEKFLNLWIQNSDYGICGQSIEKLYDSTILELCKNEAIRNKMLTNYLNHDNEKFHVAASEIISYLRVRRVLILELDQKVLSTLEYKDLLFMCRKILGYVIDSKTLCSLIYSILRAVPTKKEVASLVSTIFVKHIGVDYPYQTLDLLNSELSTLKEGDPRKKIIQKIVSRIEEKTNEHKRLPVLNELKIAKKYSLPISIEEHKNMKRIMEDVEEKSIFKQISTTVNLKYGTGWMSQQDGIYGGTRPLTKCSESIEVPWTEISRRVTAIIERASFRSAKRED